MPMRTCVEILINHNNNCREPILQTFEQLPKEDLTKDLGVGKRSIRDILVHLMNVENYWISLFCDKDFKFIDPENFHDIPSIRGAWCEIEDRTVEFMQKLSDEQLLHVRNVSWKKGTVSFTIGKALIHMATHETHHRGVLVGLARQLGLEPPDVNML